MGRTAEHAAGAYGVLFADVIALTVEPDLNGTARDAIGAVAAHLAGMVGHAQSDGQVSFGTDPEAAAWLLLSLLSARRLRGRHAGQHRHVKSLTGSSPAAASTAETAAPRAPAPESPAS